MIISELMAQADAGLFASANHLRQMAFGRNAHMCAIINIKSGDCAMDCKFCGQSRNNRTNAPVYPLLPDAELKTRIMRLANLPIARIGLVASGGFLAGEEFERLCRVSSSLPLEIRERLCASLGRLSASQLARLKAAGIGNYHHNLETSEAYYPHVCSTQTWQQRKDTVIRAKEAGFQICCGFLFGLGESWVDRHSLAGTLLELGVDNVPMNFLIPHPGSGFAAREKLAPGEVLRIIAFFRHIMPRATLRVCGGRGACLGDRQEEIFRAGANAIMTGDYLTTKGESLKADLEMLARQGLVNTLMAN